MLGCCRKETWVMMAVIFSIQFVAQNPPVKTAGVLLGPVDGVPLRPRDSEPVLLLAPRQDLAGLQPLLHQQPRAALQRPEPGQHGLQVHVLRVEDAAAPEVDLLGGGPRLGGDGVHGPVCVVTVSAPVSAGSCCVMLLGRLLSRAALLQWSLVCCHTEDSEQSPLMLLMRKTECL